MSRAGSPFGHAVIPWPTLSLADEFVHDAPERAAATIRQAVGIDRAVQLDGQELRLILDWGRFEVTVTEELRSDIGGAEAMLIPIQPDTFQILVDPRPHGGWRRPLPREEREAVVRRRIRFRVAHEIAHALFYDRSPGRQPVRQRPPGPDEEAFCDRFAAALLLPPEAISIAPPRADAVYDLMEQYDVSLHVAARSIAAYHPEVLSVALVLDSRDGPEVQWSSDASAAHAALSEILGRGEISGGQVEWCRRGGQGLRLGLRFAAAT